MIGVGELSVNSVNSVNAIVGNDPKRTDLPSDYAIAVNTGGAFFNSQVNINGVMKRTNSGGWSGGTNQAQVFMLLHELGHYLSGEGIKPDFNDAGAGRSNDVLVNMNCFRTINGAGRMR